MYKAIRAILIIAVLQFGYGVTVLMISGWPWSMYVVAGAIGVRTIRKGKSLWAHGTARWASLRDLASAGMIDGDRGLMIGKLIPGSDPPRWFDVVPALFNPRIQSKWAVYWFNLTARRRQGHLVRLPKAVHTGIFAPTGVGKGASIIVPWLLECDESAVVIDFKGENAALTAKHRAKKFGHKVVLLDPWKIVTKQPATLNPLDCIDQGPEAIDDCRDLAEQIVIKTGEEKEPHWNAAAEMWIAAAAAAVARHAVQDRSLQAVCEVLSKPEKVKGLIELLGKSDGMLPRLGGQLAHFVDRELGSTLTTTNRHLSFLNTPAVAESTSTSSFDPRELRKGKMTVYLIIPPEHMRAAAGLMRTWVGTLMRAVVRGGLNPTSNVNFVLDEASGLGPMECINDALDKYRAYGIRCHFFFQSIGQLASNFPKDRGQTAMSNMTQIFFGVNDADTAKHVSERLGGQTLVVESGGTSRGDSIQRSHMGNQGHHSRSNNVSDNWSQIARKLLTPEEVTGLNERVAITFPQSYPPIWTRLERYYEKRVGPPRFQMLLAMWTAAVAITLSTSWVLIVNVLTRSTR